LELKTLGETSHKAKAELFNLRNAPNQAFNIRNSNRKKTAALKALLTKYQTDSGSATR
jgi:hypothetical protein